MVEVKVMLAKVVNVEVVVRLVVDILDVDILVVNVLVVARLVFDILYVVILVVNKLVVASVSHFWFAILKDLPGLH